MIFKHFIAAQSPTRLLVERHKSQLPPPTIAYFSKLSSPSRFQLFRLLPVNFLLCTLDFFYSGFGLVLCRLTTITIFRGRFPPFIIYFNIN